MSYDVRELYEKLLAQTEKIIVGKSDRIRLVIMAILAGGHVLINDLPGVGKTTLVKTLSIALGLDFKRVQFVSDLLPSDIVGMKIYNQKTGEFELRKGPVMTNVLLADEINRAIPRTQSALLEAMEERQVTIDGDIIGLPTPFVVLATENPVESESTFHLPAAQMDRFLISISMGYPTPQEEIRMLEIVGNGIPFDSVERVADARQLELAMETCRKVHVCKRVEAYFMSIVDASRHDPRLRVGASPRASRALYQASRVLAAMNGRDYVDVDDIQELVHPVLDHRVILDSSARFSGVDANAIIEDILHKCDASISVEELRNG